MKTSRSVSRYVQAILHRLNSSQQRTRRRPMSRVCEQAEPRCLLAATFSPSTINLQTSGNFGVVATDLNGDSNPDVAVSNSSGYINVSLGNGLGGFGSRLDAYTGVGQPDVFSLAHGQIAGSSLPELVVGSFSSGGVRVMSNNGNGNFSQGSFFNAGGSVTGVAVGDLNGDGTNDIVAARYNQASVIVFYLNNSGGLITSSIWSTGSQPREVIIADLDGDGRRDIVSANGASGTLTVLRNLGGGPAANFSTSTISSGGSTPVAVHAADFSGDGLLDLVVTNVNSVSQQLGYFRNTGGGNFTASGQFSVASGPWGITSLDFDRDGRLDIAVAVRNANLVQVLRNIGGTSFAFDSQFSASSPFEIVAADFNKDGRMDLGTSSVNQAIANIFIGTTNSAPLDIALSNSTIDENLSANTVVGNLSATDPNTLDTHTFSLVSGEGSTDNSKFTIVGNSLRTAQPLDFETQSTLSIRVRAQDAYTGAFEKVLTINVEDVNEMPLDIELSNNTIAENAPSGTLVGLLSALDPDFDDSHTFSVITGATDKFTVSGNQLLTTQPFNFEQQSAYSITVLAVDEGGLSRPVGFSIFVTNVNESPTDLALSNSTLSENQPADTSIGLFSSTDPDSGGSFTYSLVPGDGDTDNAHFTIDGDTLKTVAPFDYETQSSYSIRVRTTDQGGLSYDKVFVVHVTDVAAQVGGVFDGSRIVPNALRLAAPLNELTVTFADAVSTAGGSNGLNSVLNPSNWQVLRNQEDVTAQISNVTFGYDPERASYAATLGFLAPLDDGQFTVRLKDSIHDESGAGFDGDSNGTPGGDFVRTFVVAMITSPLAESRVNTTTAGDQTLPIIAMNAAGSSVVVWQSFGQDGNGWGVYAQRYDAAGNPVGSEILVPDVVNSDEGAPHVAMDAAGNFVVTWNALGRDGSDIGVYAKRFHADGTPNGSDFLVNTYTTGDQRNPSVAMAPNGDFVISWESWNQDGHEWGVYAQRYNAAGVAQGPETLVNTYTTSFQWNTHLAMDAAGNYTIVWDGFTYDGNEWGVFGQRFNSTGAKLGGEFKINTFDAGIQGGNAIGMDDAGNFVVTWSSYAQDGSGNGIYARRYASTGDVLGTEFLVNTYTFGDQQNPGVTMDADGDFVITWASFAQDGDSWGVFGQRYSPSGTAQGSEFALNSFTTSEQWWSSVAMNSNGDLTAIWHSFGQDETDWGVFRRQFLARVTPTDIQLSSNSILENAAISTEIGTFSTSDVDATDAFTYMLVPGLGADDNHRFMIAGNVLTAEESFDYETQSSYSIRVRTTDQGGLSFEKVFTIDVTDVAEDVTPPESLIATLPASSGLSFPLTVSAYDPGGLAASGVAEIDFYYSTGGSFIKFATTPASNPSVDFTGAPNSTYWFRSIARDYAGNVESKTSADTFTRIGDVVPPVTQVTSATHNSSGLFTIDMTGSKVGGAPMTAFEVYVVIDSNPPIFVGSAGAGAATAGVYSASLSYQGLTDGNSHTYRFYSIGIDSSGNVEAIPVSGDVSVTASFSPGGLTLAAIDVQNGRGQRSYVRHLDLLFSSDTGLSSLANTGRVRVERFGIDAASVTPGTGALISGFTVNQSGNRLKLDFGATGLGGLRQAGNGFYRVLVDVDGNGTFTDAGDGAMEFHRLFGDADGNGIVDIADTNLVTSQIGRIGTNLDGDLDGNGAVNSTDRLFTIQQRGKKLLDPLLGWLDD